MSKRFYSLVLGGALPIVLMMWSSFASAQYYIYRGVGAVPSEAVVWMSYNHGVSGTPATLSFFHYANDDAAREGMDDRDCLLRVDLGALDNPAPNTTADAGVDLAEFQVLTSGLWVAAMPWQAVFDNNPEGHWSIRKDQILAAGHGQSMSNTRASIAAAAGLQNAATTGDTGITVVNGTKDNCRP